MIIDQIIYKKQEKKESEAGAELKSRSILKALSWRMVGTLDTILISWLISGKLEVGLAIGTFELITKTLLYYFHERFWNTIKWGK